MLIYVIYRLIQHDTGCKTVHALCELHLHWFRDKLHYDFGYVKVPKATYDTQYIRKSIQTLYSISKSTFKLIKSVDIYNGQIS